MSGRGRTRFGAVRTEGGLLPADLLDRVVGGDSDVPGLDPADYHLLPGERIHEATSRAWARLLPAWRSFRNARTTLAEGSPDAAFTRERWLLVLFQELGYGRLETARGLEIEGKAYPISHLWQGSPIHLVGASTDLDGRTKGIAGAARQSPHSLVQELLNRSKEYLWGFVSNGLELRLLRDNVSLTRQAYVAFDLTAMMEGEAYSDFALLWLVAHQSRVERRGDPVCAESCWLEEWTRVARDRGTRALDELRGGVEQAVAALGSGFLAHPANGALRDSLRRGQLGAQDYYRELLRLVYRLIFLFVAEDRESEGRSLLLDPSALPEARALYADHYSTRRLRALAERRRGGPHMDLYRGLRLVMAKLGDDRGCPELALPALGSFLWSREAIPNLGDANIANHDLLVAVRALAFTIRGRVFRAVDYRNLGSEELGSIYESLLELHPEIDTQAGSFALRTAAGHERKTTGSYYTPSSLIQCLLDTALDPVLDEAARKPDPEQAILELNVCDPACGSGHFLIAAAHRMARRLATVRTGEAEPSPTALRASLRDVIGRCLYGVDLNPMAVELCKVSLWLEALEPGKPLSFLDAHIQCGNSLLGATPAVLERGIPDEALDPIEGDDKRVVGELRKRNRAERRGQETLFTDFIKEVTPPNEALAAGLSSLAAVPDDTITVVREKEATFRRLAGSPEYRNAKMVADAWCSAFVWRKTREAPEAVTDHVFRRLRRDPQGVPTAILDEIARLAEQYSFFHWYLAFPDVFRIVVDTAPENESAGRSGGFDVVLGNPPWERMKIQEKEFFATRHPEIADAPNAAARRNKIAALGVSDPALSRAFADARRQAEGESQFVRQSGRFPLCGRGDVNTYAVFAEGMWRVATAHGRVGCIVPTGIATDDTTKRFFQELVDSGSLSSLYDFQSSPGLFGEIGHARFKFCLLTVLGCGRPADTNGAEFAFFLRDTAHLADPARRFRLTANEIALLNPNSRTCPIFRSRRDADITKAIYARTPVFVREAAPEANPWCISFMTMFHMSNDSQIFRSQTQLEADGWILRSNIFTQEGARYLPLYEAKMMHHFDHRFGDYRDRQEGSENTALPMVPSGRLNDPCYSPTPRYWVPEAAVDQALGARWQSKWLFGWRDITNATNERTVIASVIPRVGAGNKIPLMLLAGQNIELAFALVANLSAVAFDYAARQKMGGTTLNFFIYKQLPVVPPHRYQTAAPWDRNVTLGEWLLPRVIELTYTAWDVEEFASDCGYEGAPFRWDETRRFLLRCEIDAAFFHLYEIGREEAEYIMETFPIVRRHDEAVHAEYRTKRVILDAYDALETASASGEPYRTLLDPPPADPRVAHPVAKAG